MVSSKKLILVTLIYAVIVLIMAITVREDSHISTSAPALSASAAEAELTLGAVELDNSFFEPVVTEKSTSTPVQNPPKVSTPVITARAYLIGNVKTGEIYLERNSSSVMPVASMSKLVTAFVATDILSDDAIIEITERAMQEPPDTSGMAAGERFTLKEILFPLLLNSSNIVAESLASNDNREEFLAAMNSYAWEVGMPNGYFADPSGVSPLNSASARDIFGLARYLFEFRKDILALTRNADMSIDATDEHRQYQFTSTHPFVNDSRFIGGKTGRTPEAGETMMTIMNIKNQPIVLIVMGSEYGAREGDTRMLLEKAESVLK